MINIRTLKGIPENGGLTLKKGKIVNYKTGWQVATSGIECTDIQSAMEAIKSFNGNCGVWLSNGIFYVDKSFRVDTKKEALAIGRENNQISVFGWKRKNLAYC